jgi:biotin carboxyl carrier protein
VAVREGDRIWIWCEGVTAIFERVSGARSAVSREPGGDLISPMPGRVRRTLVADGERVRRGQVLLVLEAMKMEHSIRAPKDGSVRLRVREGDLVEAGVELAEIQ